MRRDPHADMGRRAWVPCPQCADHRECETCQLGQRCEDHWRFLLSADGRNMFVQCGGCLHRWWHDTRFGAGTRRLDDETLRPFPPPGRLAA